MMRGLRPLVSVAAVAWAASANAQEMVEVPNAPPPPPPCCAVAAPKLREPGWVLASIMVGASYRRAFREDFAAAAVEFEIGGQTRSFGVAGRAQADFGATRVGLPYQMATFGPSFWFHLSPRVRFGFGMTFGVFAYERVSAAMWHDSTVWAPTVGGDLDLTVDLTRNARDGGLYLLTRASYDWIDNVTEDFATGSSLGLTAAIGYRY